MTFIKFCVGLYKTNVEPMLKKLKRTDEPSKNTYDKSSTPFEKLKKSTFANNLRQQAYKRLQEEKELRMKLERLKLNNYHQDENVKVNEEA
jgi:hypothetical protein